MKCYGHMIFYVFKSSSNSSYLNRLLTCQNAINFEQLILKFHKPNNSYWQILCGPFSIVSFTIILSLLSILDDCKAIVHNCFLSEFYNIFYLFIANDCRRHSVFPSAELHTASTVNGLRIYVFFFEFSNHTVL